MRSLIKLFLVESSIYLEMALAAVSCVVSLVRHLMLTMRTMISLLRSGGCADRVIVLDIIQLLE